LANKLNCVSNKEGRSLTFSSIIYPALHSAANDLSDSSQKVYLWELRIEYTLLITCAAMSINSPNSSAYYYIFTFVFVSALMVFLHRFASKPEQSWYKGRALAESVKTSSWKFAMKAAPFDDADETVALGDFRNLMKKILETNRFAAERLSSNNAEDAQVTVSMLYLRQSSLDKRIRTYDEFRIRDQRTWYTRKARLNKKSALTWAILCILVYILAIFSSLVHANYPSWTFLPTEPLIAIASSIIGWMQIKKFNELSSAYTLTAHEIGFLCSLISTITDENKFSDFVNEAELAFSREHTQWAARLST
jgi:SMODS and SLOG-associating 2TM effector domain 1/SMODS and SLOG-associating 2TM effector domain 3